MINALFIIRYYLVDEFGFAREFVDKLTTPYLSCNRGDEDQALHQDQNIQQEKYFKELKMKQIKVNQFQLC